LLKGRELEEWGAEIGRALAKMTPQQRTAVMLGGLALGLAAGVLRAQTVERGE
jgi:hypothetical protein